MRHPMIDYLSQAAERDDRALFAQLRRAASLEMEATAYPVVARFFTAEPNPRMERALVDVAVLFAQHPASGEASLAVALRRLASKDKDRGGAADGIERRFVAMLNAHDEDLVPHLRHAIAQLRAAEIAIDWNDLLETLLRWGHPERYAQRRWARAFWSAPTTTDDEDQEVAP